MRQVERTKVPGPPGRVSLPRSRRVPSHGSGQLPLGSDTPEGTVGIGGAGDRSPERM